MLPETPLNILVVGGGGREHALCWKLAQSTRSGKIYCAPGNGGTAGTVKTVNVDIETGDFPGLAGFAQTEKIDLVVVGPDNPLAGGLVDFLEDRQLRVFGPTRAQARLEWSKVYAKKFLQTAGMPTARFLTCSSLSDGCRLIKENNWARVVKVDGLALGKGVYVCGSETEAGDALAQIFRQKKFGDAGLEVVLEEKLSGQELSLLAFCDGRRLHLMPACRDHKRRFDGDAGPNTGGMGAYCPVPLYERCKQAVAEQVILPLQEALADGRLSFKGVLYIGLMVDSFALPGGAGEMYRPYVLEFNARFGDPETQALLPRLKSDLLPVLWSCTEGTLDQVTLDWGNDASCCVVAVTESYPAASSKGKEIKIGRLPPGVVLFHAGTTLSNGVLQTAGGRILSVTGMAPSMEAASANAYAALEVVSFPEMSYRTDIIGRAMKQCLSS